MAKKYIDADRLKAEIESRMGNYDANSKNPNQLLWAELAALIPFIDSLQQEQPSEGLGEAAEKFVYDWAGLSPTERRIAERAYLAGAEWQKSQDESRRIANIQLANTDTPVDSEMEVAFNDIWRDAEVIVERDGTLDEKATELMKAVCHDFFESGKEWQKQQMPKWKKNGGLLRFAILEDENGRYVQHEGYKIYFNDLLKSQKED